MSHSEWEWRMTIDVDGRQEIESGVSTLQYRAKGDGVLPHAWYDVWIKRDKTDFTVVDFTTRCVAHRLWDEAAIGHRAGSN
ncbi:hypothetical protein OOK29_09700 [Streptomyces phaeochromogenes]|uniref:hypothetical protein n=1 Tax=Streptomyces phaeochromogenes TaxID=1923 RepID=UPI0022565E20|nr:hypothetical protein [Streptomyces phaeochromogenes]MCX5598411.1 hypothetical protein [Streptomyces phaeochromogenes]